MSASNRPIAKRMPIIKTTPTNGRERLKVTMEHPKESAPERLIIEIDGTKARIVESFFSGASVITSRPAPRAGNGRKPY